MRFCASGSDSKSGPSPGHELSPKLMCHVLPGGDQNDSRPPCQGHTPATVNSHKVPARVSYLRCAWNDIRMHVGIKKTFEFKVESHTTSLIYRSIWTKSHGEPREYPITNRLISETFDLIMHLPC